MGIEEQTPEVIKVEDLIIEGFDHMVNYAMETVRVELKIPKDDFSQMIKSEDGKVFDIIYDVLITELIKRDFTEKYLKRWQRTTAHNNRAIIAMHKRPFLYFIGYLHTCFQIYNRTRLALDGKILDKKTTLNVCLYGHLCRMADEICILLTHGYTAGALTLWRSFYEHAVVGLLLLKENSDTLTDRFEAAGHRGLEIRSESYTKRYQDLEFPPLEAQIIMDIEKRSAWLRQNFETQLFKQDYGWAAIVITDEKPTFRAIENYVEMGRFRPFYIWSSNMAHPNFDRLTDFQDGEQRMVLNRVIEQQTDLQSFVDPMQLTTACFQAVNSAFLHIFSPDHQYDANITILEKLYEKLSSNFSSSDTKEHNNNNSK